MSEDAPEKPVTDVVLLHSPTEDGQGARVVRVREDRLEVGEVRALQEGKPVAGEVIRLKPREENRRICDVEVLLPGPKPATQKGPARVTTDAYRESWNRIFSSRAGQNASLN